MGWASASEIFDPVCAALVTSVEGGGIAPEEATKVLATVIRALQDNDWDTEEDSLRQFEEHQFVVDAFVEQGVGLYDDEDDE